jgi:hypothetical protein
MKRYTGKIRFTVFLLIAALFVQTAAATTTTILPFSSHYQGRSYYRQYTQDGVLSGRIEFAVYDSLGGNEFADAGFTVPGTGQYTYVYQIFNDGDDAEAAFQYLAILGIGEGAIDDLVADMSSIDDGDGGAIDATAMYFAVHDANTGPDKAIWEFEGGIFGVDEHSFFLVLCSDNNYAKGTFQIIRSTAPEVPLPNPEPGTLALLGVGGMLALLRRRRAV